jgi:hypothetical protein
MMRPKKVRTKIYLHFLFDTTGDGVRKAGIAIKRAEKQHGKKGS